MTNIQSRFCNSDGVAQFFVHGVSCFVEVRNISLCSERFCARLNVTEMLFFQVGACVSGSEGGHIVCNCFCLIGFSSLLATCGRRGGFR